MAKRAELQRLRQTEEARKYAGRCAEQGVAMLAHALNACDNPMTPYRYSEEAQVRFRVIVMELAKLIDEGDVEINPIANARKDSEFQLFMAHALDRPRHRVGSGAAGERARGAGRR